MNTFMAPCPLLFKANLSRPRRYLFTLSCTLGCLWLVACGNGENNVTTGLQSQTLHWGNGAEPQALDPHIVTGIPEHPVIIGLRKARWLKSVQTQALTW